jgi:hypothetical protein
MHIGRAGEDGGGGRGRAVGEQIMLGWIQVSCCRNGTIGSRGSTRSDGHQTDAR